MTRKQERVGLLYRLRLFDAATGLLIGHITDLTRDGFLVIAETTVPTNCPCRLRMDLPRIAMRGRELSFSAECLWSRRDASGDYFNMGFRITEVSPKATQTIQRLIRRFPSEDAEPGLPGSER
jgi:hypothetical protein